MRSLALIVSTTAIVLSSACASAPHTAESSSSATVLQAIASQQSSLTTLISSGRVVAQTFAAQAGAFGRGLDQLNALLSTAQTALPITRPFLARARPALQHLASTAGLLTPALAALRPAVRAARSC